jgi:hypothetical protein
MAKKMASEATRTSAKAKVECVREGGAGPKRMEESNQGRGPTNSHGGEVKVTQMPRCGGASLSPGRRQAGRPVSTHTHQIHQSITFTTTVPIPMHTPPTQSPSMRTAFHALPQSACPASTPACKEHVQTTSTASLQPHPPTHRRPVHLQPSPSPSISVHCIAICIHRPA